MQHKHTCTDKYAHTHVRTWINSQVYTRAHTCMHVHTHTFTHTHTRTQTHSHSIISDALIPQIKAIEPWARLIHVYFFLLRHRLHTSYVPLLFNSVLFCISFPNIPLMWCWFPSQDTWSGNHLAIAMNHNSSQKFFLYSLTCAHIHKASQSMSADLRSVLLSETPSIRDGSWS
jgi:predicted protein tyrosine phosphatase